MPRKSKSKLALVLQSNPDGQPIAGVGSGVGLEFIKAYFPEAENTIRIASAYFSLVGYKLGRKYVASEVQFQILVGREDGKHVRATVIDEIMADLGQCDTDLWRTVFELVERMKSGRFIIRDARKMQVPFHCKFYICDSKLIWHGSSNYSRKGLCQSAEQVSVSHDSERICLFTNWYDHVAQNAQDLLAELIKKLEDWLNLATPFEVYLKTLFLLNNLAEYPLSLDAYSPVYYQKGVIARALRQANEYGGALIIAATGLGKTVIGAEIALRLQPIGRTNQVILIAPSVVRKNWERQLENRNVYFKFFNIDVLFRKASQQSHHQTDQLERQLQQANHNTIIIIDEAHFYRNELLREKSKRGKSLVYERIVPAIKAGAKIFLLTATAYGTDFLNLNSLLYLLPHRFYNPNLLDEQSPWKINNAEEFSRLPIVTILGLPHVLKMARNRGDIDTNGRTFIQFGDERRYLPKSLKLYSLRYQLFLQPELQSAFDRRCFDQAFKSPHQWFDDDRMALRESAIDTVYNASLTSWLSSPIAMAYSIEQNLATTSYSEQFEGVSQLTLNLWQQSAVNVQNQDYYSLNMLDTHNRSYKTPMRISLEERSNILMPILAQLRQSNYIDDKFLKLQKIIEDCCLDTRGKVIIFVKRYLTAQYLLTLLQRTFSGALSIGCTVETDEDNPRLKTGLQRFEVLKQFSPRSHNYKANREYDVLICTDADGVGVDLQDADTVVNYDPPEGADELFQRAGRVLRMTSNPERVVQFYTLVPLIIDQRDSPSRVHNDICERFDRIAHRHNKSKRILGSGVISEEEHSEITLDSDLDVEQLTRDNKFLTDIGGLGAESMLSHVAVLEQYRSRAEELPEYLLSARSYSKPQRRIFVLLKHEGKYYPILFNLSNKKLEKQDELAILDLIACIESELCAAIQAAEIEKIANQAARAWCDFENISIDQVSKICGLYLVPIDKTAEINRLLDDTFSDEE
ncbi:MAG: helicase-related protein [Nostoc sp.]|uniref:helicase-related protein n=1 Tax=Nostoc sp. TaxID=1180 RepID=UPI002FF4B15C